LRGHSRQGSSLILRGGGITDWGQLLFICFPVNPSRAHVTFLLPAYLSAHAACLLPQLRSGHATAL